MVRHSDVAVVKPFAAVFELHRIYDRFALDRSLVLLVSDYNTELVANL